MTKKILRLRRFRGSGQDDSEHSFVILSEVQSKDFFRSYIKRFCSSSNRSWVISASSFRPFSLTMYVHRP